MSKKTLHGQISEDLLNKILEKKYHIDEMIPKEVDLAKQYGVSRPTIRQAIQSLVDYGYLERIKGTGTFVRNKKIDQDFTHVIKSYDDEMKSKGLIPKTKVIDFSIQKSNHDISKNLQIDKGEGVYRLSRLRYANNVPIVLVTTYIPIKIYPELKNEDFTKVSLYDTFAEHGNPINSAKRNLSVKKADHIEAAMLEVEVDDPIFYFKTVGYSIQKEAIEYSLSWYRGDNNTFEIKINI